MVRTLSTMPELGTQAPEFSLEDLDGIERSLQSFAAKKALLVMFISKHCPFVRHIQDELARIGRDYQNSDLAIVAISSNDIERYPDDAPEELSELSARLDFTFPVCFDETQEVARRFRAACTPDFFLYDSERVLVYRGQLDESRPDNGKPVTGRDLRRSIDAVLEDRSVDPKQRPSLGCNIKWKPGNEPDYFSSSV